MTLEDQARAALHLLLEPANETDQAGALGEDCRCCPNCDRPVEKLSSPYCSESCKARAAFVRQLRNAMAAGSILSPEKQVVFGERLWWLLGGGLPLRESRIPESAKRQVLKRSGGMCELCGKPMMAVENFGSGCNRPLHLRAVCAECSSTKSYGDLEFSRSSPVVTILRDLSRRIGAKKPLRQCDDHENWNWRAFMAGRRP